MYHIQQHKLSQGPNLLKKLLRVHVFKVDSGKKGEKYASTSAIFYEVISLTIILMIEVKKEISLLPNEIVSDFICLFIKTFLLEISVLFKFCKVKRKCLLTVYFKSILNALIFLLTLSVFWLIVGHD